MNRLPLDGIRVITTTMVWAGPFAEMLLADWGAEVIRMESIRYFAPTTRGMLARPPEGVAKKKNPWCSYVNCELGEKPWNRCSTFNSHARNKLSITVDLTKPQGVEVFKRLVKVSDVVIDNQSYGVLERFGLGYPALKEVKSNIIMVSITGFGNSGPYRKFRAIAACLEAYLGHTYLRGYPGLDSKSTSSVAHSDAASGATAAFAIMMALHYRRRTGKGQFIDVSMAEATISHLGDVFMDYFMNQRMQSPLGNHHRWAAPHSCFRCKGEDKWVNISVTCDEEWKAFCRVLGNPSLEKDKRFADMLSRHKNQDVLDKLIEAWTQQYDNYEIMHILQKEGIPAGVVIDEKDAFNDPHLKDRGFFEELTQDDCGTHLYPGLLWKAANTPNAIRRPPVRLGEHNEYVYKQLLGFSDSEYAELEREGHIGMDYAPEVA
jgi:crotonobetainyl-CoA:carnitine CoA-transferase CaiB-like acyl-CoA transferase